MGKKFLKLIVGFLSGYMFVEWVPIMTPFSLSAFFLDLVLNPLEFLAATVSFTVGFLVNGDLIRETIFNRLKAWRRKIHINAEAFIGIGVILGMVFLFEIGFIQAIVFFSISCIYGMISLDY